MKPETLEAIKNMTGEFAKELSKFIDSKDTIKMSNNGINGVITGIFTKHITKYAELLESEREKSEKLRDEVQMLKKELAKADERIQSKQEYIEDLEDDLRNYQEANS